MSSFAPQGLLWHYTDIHGLLGILPSLGQQDNGGQFHASNISMMNDSAEVSFGIFKIQEMLRREISRIANGNWRHEEALSQQYLQPFMWQLGRHVSKHEHTRNIYSVSLSRNGDQLSQWRGYAADGYAIGFNEDALSSAIDHPNNFDHAMGDRIELDSVEYLGPNSEADLEKVSNSGDWNRVHHMLLENQDVGAVYDYLWNTFMFRAAFWKSESFREEEEIRIVARTNKPPSFKASPFGPKGYLTIPFPFSAVKAIIVSPGSHADARFASTEQYAALLSSGNIQVIPSSITYRGQ